MKKQSILRLMIAAMIVSAAFFVMAARHASSQQMSGKEDCTADKACEQQPQSEFVLEGLARLVLGK